MATVYSNYSYITQTSYGYHRWVDLNNIIDNTENTYASCIIDDDPIYKDTEYVYVGDTGIDTESRVDFIRKVEIGFKGYVDINSGIAGLLGYNNTVGFSSGYLFTGVTTTSEEHWIDITNEGSCPGYDNWEWSDIYGLQIQMYMTTGTDDDDIATFFIDKIQLRITTIDSDDPVYIYGLRCKDENGNVTLSVDDSITRVLYSNILDSNVSETIIVSGDVRSEFVGFTYALDLVSLPHSFRRSWWRIEGNTKTEEWIATPVSINNGDISIPSSRSKIIIMGY